MDCTKCGDDLSAYIDGEVSDSTALDIKAHLEACEICREERRTLELSARFVEDHMREIQIRPEVWGRVQARLSAMEAPASTPGLFHWLTANPWWSTAAASIATAALALGLWGYVRHEAAQKDLVRYMTQYIEARDKEEASHRSPAALHGGSTVDGGAAQGVRADNPFVNVNWTGDMNPFRAEGQ